MLSLFLPNIKTIYKNFERAQIVKIAIKIRYAEWIKNKSSIWQ